VNNDCLISVNVFETNDAFNENNIIKPRATKVLNAKYHIDLLRVFADKDRCHYALIRSLSRLLNCQLNKDNNKTHISRYCSQPVCKKRGLGRTS